MKLYLYDYVQDLTTSYHSSGGLVIITNGEPSYSRPKDDWDSNSEAVFIKLPEPILVIEVPDTTPAGVFSFPNAGCC